MVLLYGPAKYLFTPLAFAVVAAMLASYLLSRTLVPVLSDMLMKGERHLDGDDSPHSEAQGRVGRFVDRLNHRRDAAFERFRDAYTRLLENVMAYRPFTLVVGLLVLMISAGLIFVVGMDFFPEVDAGLMKLHFRAPAGTRIEETERILDQVEKSIREVIPAGEIDTINDMIGVPIFFNLAFVQTDNVAGMDADILIALKEGHRPTAIAC